ncbi:hypothetical protein ACN38_g6610 [Penicillium nordicum]|uniref:Uncharacterized protein n=1 Tax=Penicillium nordicum TaxID=229535 RepID=A0A0M8NZN3_9EURO|nr:hypothetical protein ACN38_g6610 [Penicillium nordicum]
MLHIYMNIHPGSWRLNHVSVGQSSGRGPLSSDVRLPPFSLPSPANLDPVGSHVYSVSSSAHTEPDEPKPVSGASGTKPCPRSDTGPNRESTERLSSDKRDSPHAIADLADAL